MSDRLTSDMHHMHPVRLYREFNEMPLRHRIEFVVVMSPVIVLTVWSLVGVPLFTEETFAVLEAYGRVVGNLHDAVFLGVMAMMAYAFGLSFWLIIRGDAPDGA